MSIPVGLIEVLKLKNMLSENYRRGLEKELGEGYGVGKLKDVETDESAAVPFYPVDHRGTEIGIILPTLNYVVLDADFKDLVQVYNHVFDTLIQKGYLPAYQNGTQYDKMNTAVKNHSITGKTSSD